MAVFFPVIMSHLLRKNMPKAPPLQQEEERGEEDQVVSEGAEGGKATGDGEISVNRSVGTCVASPYGQDGRP